MDVMDGGMSALTFVDRTAREDPAKVKSHFLTILQAQSSSVFGSKVNDLKVSNQATAFITEDLPCQYECVSQVPLPLLFVGLL